MNCPYVWIPACAGMTVMKERYRREFSPDGVLGVSPIFIKSPKIGGYRGLTEIATLRSQ